jgi:UDP-glucose 4-epimerase
MPKKILVTGSAGFIGSHIADLLIKKGFSVYGVDDLSGGFMRNVSRRQKFTKLDLRDRKKVEKYINKIKPEIVIHLAADATEGRSQFTPFSALDRNAVSYLNLIVPAIKNGMKKMVLTSSMSVYGGQQVPFKESMIPQPEDVYGYSKMWMEGITKVFSNVYGFEYTIIRPHNVYGERQNLSDPYRNVIGIFINRLLKGKGFYIYGDGKQKRAFSYIDDVSKAFVDATFSKKCNGKIINIGGEKNITLNKLAEIVLKAFFDGKVPVEFKPKHLKDRPQEVKYAYSSHDEARKLVNFEAKTSIEEGIKKMITWAKKIGKQDFIYLKKMDLENKLIPETWSKKLL